MYTQERKQANWPSFLFFSLFLLTTIILYVSHKHLGYFCKSQKQPIKTRMPHRLGHKQMIFGKGTTKTVFTIPIISHISSRNEENFCQNFLTCFLTTNADNVWIENGIFIYRQHSHSGKAIALFYEMVMVMTNGPTII